MTNFLQFIKSTIQDIPYINSQFMIKLIESIILLILFWLIKILIFKIINKMLDEYEEDG